MEMGDNHREWIMFLVTDTGNHNILLGMDWLRAHNPNINWTQNTIHMDRCPSLCRPRQTPGPTIAYSLPTCDWEMQIDNDTDISINSIDMSQHIMAHMEQQMPEIARTTVSTTLAVTVRPRCRIVSKSGSVFSRRSGWYCWGLIISND
jgi:hypothetical protein